VKLTASLILILAALALADEKIITLCWKWSTETNVPTRVLWTDNLTNEWQVAVTNVMTNSVKFKSTNERAFFKLEREPL
jgi:hypothetical protein